MKILLVCIWTYLLLVVPSAYGSGSTGGTTPIQKVLELLGTMLEKGKEEKHEEEVVFSKFKEFCTLNRADKGRTIKTAEESIVSLEAAVSKADADADRFGDEIAALDTDMASREGEAQKATEVRKAEDSEFMATHLDYEESISALDRALQTLRSASADVPQAPVLAQLREAMSSRRLSESAKAVMVAVSDEAERLTGHEAAAPEANAYEFQSTTVVDMLEKLRDRFTEEARALAKDEANRKHAYELLMQSLHDSLDHAAATRSKKVMAKAEALQESASTKGDLAATKASKAADEAYLSDLTAGCALKSQEFEARQVLRAAEIESIQKAIGIISSPEVAATAQQHLPAAMLQVQTSSARALVRLKQGAADAETVPQSQAAGFLRERAQRIQSAFLTTLAARVEADPFEKVKKMIKDLLERLMEEANDEADHKGWCDHEVATNKLSRDHLSQEVETLTSKVDEHSALVSKLAQDISDLSEEIASIKADMARATANRKEESTTNAATIADAKTAIAAVTRAIQVLKAFYAQAADATALVQSRQRDLPSDAPATWDASYTGMQGKSTGVLGLLDVIKSDFARLEATTSAEEDEAQRAFEKFMADADTDRATKDTTMRHKGYKRDSTQRQLDASKKELELTHGELTAVLEYYDKLKPSCLDTGFSYSDRVERRREEIQSLKEALSILEGNQVSGL